MSISKILVGGFAALALTVTAAATADAKSRKHYRHYSAGYGAYAFAPGNVGYGVAPRRYYGARRPTGPASMDFELGSGWNNGSVRATQYGRPNHW